MIDLEEYIKTKRVEHSVRKLGSFKSVNPTDGLAYALEHKCRLIDLSKSIPTDHEPKSVLDIGTSFFTFYLREAFPKHTIYTIDLTPVFFQQCQMQNIKHFVCDISKERLPFGDNSFDVVIFSEVLEHLYASPSAVMTEIQRIMKPKAKLILSVPNIATLRRRLEFLVGITPCHPMDDVIHPDSVHGNGHLHEYSLGEITHILKRCDIKIKNKYYLVDPLRDVFSLAEYGISYKLLRLIHQLFVLCVPSCRPIIRINGYK